MAKSSDSKQTLVYKNAEAETSSHDKTDNQPNGPHANQPDNQLFLETDRYAEELKFSPKAEYVLWKLGVSPTAIIAGNKNSIGSNSIKEIADVNRAAEFLVNVDEEGLLHDNPLLEKFTKEFDEAMVSYGNLSEEAKQRRKAGLLKQKISDMKRSNNLREWDQQDFDEIEEKAPGELAKRTIFSGLMGLIVNAAMTVRNKLSPHDRELVEDIGIDLAETTVTLSNQVPYKHALGGLVPAVTQNITREKDGVTRSNP